MLRPSVCACIGLVEALGQHRVYSSAVLRRQALEIFRNPRSMIGGTEKRVDMLQGLFLSLTTLIELQGYEAFLYIWTPDCSGCRAWRGNQATWSSNLIAVVGRWSAHTMTARQLPCTGIATTAGLQRSFRVYTSLMMESRLVEPRCPRGPGSRIALNATSALDRLRPHVADTL